MSEEGEWEIDDLVADETVLPAQFWEPTALCTPAQRLCCAVLSDALLCLAPYRQTMGAAHRAQYRADWVWLHAHDDAPFSFAWTCAALGQQAEWSRRAVMRALSRPPTEGVNAPTRRRRRRRAGDYRAVK